MAIDLSAILIQQWQGSPRLRGIVTDVIATARDEMLTAIARIDLMQHIDSAEGVWIDYIGIRLGLPRPSIADSAQDRRFGFGTAGEPFDQKPFRGAAANDALFPLPDALYRRLVRARFVAVTGDGTFATFARALGEVDPAAVATDNRDMTLSIVTSEGGLVTLADELGALPRAAGVALVYP